MCHADAHRSDAENYDSYSLIPVFAKMAWGKGADLVTRILPARVRIAVWVAVNMAIRVWMSSARAQVIQRKLNPLLKSKVLMKVYFTQENKHTIFPVSL